MDPMQGRWQGAEYCPYVESNVHLQYGPTIRNY